MFNLDFEIFNSAEQMMFVFHRVIKVDRGGVNFGKKI